ncbi:hypothetical protein NXS19_002225 [Fusarium pseudograminearum]|nr:hypothetical protein NXS19_002225 [Fusarium pseudograminearum]
MTKEQRILEHLGSLSIGGHIINATGEKKFERVGDAAYSDVGQPIGIRVVGATSFVNSEKWSPQGRAPRGPDTFVGTRLISVQTRAVANVIEEGTCPTSLQHFGQLPPVSQHEIRWAGGNDKTADYDCFLINACIYNGRDCKVVSSDKTSQSYAMCSKYRYGGDFEEDWLTGLALDFTSEVLNCQTFSSAHSELRGIPTPAYQQRTLTLSAILVFGANIVHSPMASGLCSAVSLSRQDGKLPRLRWLRGNMESGNDNDGGHELCSKKVVFAEDDTSVRALDSRRGLLS